MSTDTDIPTDMEKAVRKYLENDTEQVDLSQIWLKLGQYMIGETENPLEVSED